MRRASVVALVVIAGLAGHARGARAAAPAASTPVPSGALETLAQQVVAGLGVVPQTAVVVAAPLATDTPAPKGDELAVRLAALVAGRIGGAARSHPQAAQLGTARAVAGRSGGLVYLQTELAKGELRATADVYPAQSNGWDRIRNPVPSPTAHAFAAVKADAEVRAFLPPIVLEQASVHKAHHDEGEVLAAACGDLDGDGGNELALVSRARVAVGKLRGGRFVPTWAAPWSALAARAPSPLREPIGTAAIGREPGGDLALFVGTTDRTGVRIAATLGAHAALAAMPVGVGDVVACATPSPGAGAFEGLLTLCADEKRGQTVLYAPPWTRFDAFAAASVEGKDGVARLVFAAREPGARVHLRLGTADEGAPARTIDGAGAQLAVADLDQDGVAEVASSRDTGEDAIVLVSWAGDDVRVRRRLAAPAGVRALCACPPEERAAPALVAVVGDEVWIIR